ncbi:ABC transporter permease [Nitratireductor sp. ZSWI3]|uniref:ABC transporter permease n=1 Tax=Nitratireductor sp. ZSWI3 TaxID=2966359 RepID=UPI00214F8DFB|nr:ABC transporter permease [Nitratireductor sp. ZSWI3]MCR4269255.1 ABC transporter permease [Nitratireductor sp. ZSWI3]
MKAVLIVALKEVQEGLRNRWVVASSALLATLALTLSFLGSAPTGSVGAEPLDIVIVSLSSLTIFLVPLIALLISHDAVVGEVERGTMLLLLSYPLARWQVLTGKFLGHIAILAFATMVGYGVAAASLPLTGASITARSLTAFAAMIASSIALGGIFVAIGYLVSALAATRGAAAGAAIGVWLFFVLLFDMALLGVLVVDQGAIVSAHMLDAVLLFNPTDVYRLLNLAGSGSVGALAGMSGLAEASALSAPALLAALAAWTLLPLGAAGFAFARREL